MSTNLQSDNIEDLDKIRDGLSYAVGEPNVSVEELMNCTFIAANTDFETWEKLLEAARVKDEKDLQTTEFDAFIKSRTRFVDWETMLIQSANQYALRRESE
ncbi:MAG: hypothetical protein M3384_13690 [Acidobacteriota bacterium]|nr:hypothetical protein [Acidobacteriota bacterium]